MKTRLLTWLRADSKFDPGFSHMLITLHLIVLAGIVSVIMITDTFTGREATLWLLALLAVLVITSLLFSLYGYFGLGRVLVPVGLIISITLLCMDGLGMHDTAIVSFAGALLLGGMLVGRHGLWAFTLLCMVAVTTIAFAEMSGRLVTPLTGRTGWDDILINYTMFITIGIALNLMMKRMENSLQDAQQNEQAWRSSEERFRVFMETSPAIVIMKDEDSRYVYCNPRVESLFGRQAGEILGKTEFDLFPPDEAMQFTDSDQRVLNSGQPEMNEYAARIPSGELHDWWVFKFPMRDSTGRRYVGMQILDITERKKVEIELARERDLMQALMSSVTDTVYFKDRDSRFTRINMHQAHFLGVNSPEDAIGKRD